MIDLEILTWMVIYETAIIAVLGIVEQALHEARHRPFWGGFALMCGLFVAYRIVLLISVFLQG